MFAHVQKHTPKSICTCSKRKIKQSTEKMTSTNDQMRSAIKPPQLIAMSRLTNSNVCKTSETQLDFLKD